MKILIYEEYTLNEIPYSLGLKRIVEGQSGVKRIEAMPSQPFFEVRYDHGQYRDLIPLGNVKAYRTSEPAW